MNLVTLNLYYIMIKGIDKTDYINKPIVPFWENSNKHFPTFSPALSTHEEPVIGRNADLIISCWLRNICFLSFHFMPKNKFSLSFIKWISTTNLKSDFLFFSYSVQDFFQL